MGKYGLSEMEHELMEFFWENEGLHSFAEVMKYCNEEKGHNWAQTTIHTYLTRLIQKGVLYTSRTGYRKYYQAQMSKDQMIAEEVCKSAKELSVESVKGLLIALTRQAELTKEDIEALYRILDEK